MAGGFFMACLLAGAGAVALWTDARFPDLVRPEVAALTRHFAGALVALVVVIPAGTQLVAGPGSSLGLALLSLFAIAFPALVYSMLVALGMIKLAQRALRGDGLR